MEFVNGRFSFAFNSTKYFSVVKNYYSNNGLRCSEVVATKIYDV